MVEKAPVEKPPVGSESTPPEAELVERARGGDLCAFETLISKYQRAVFHIALYKSKNYFDAEDLTQDIFLAAFRALETLKTPESFGGWLFGIAYNRCHKWFRRERNKVIKIQEVRQKALEDERRRWKETQPGPSPRSSEEHLSEVLLRLPEEVRQALTLKYLEGMSYQDIGKRLGINSHRIDYLIRKGKQMIRDRMGRGEAQA